MHSMLMYSRGLTQAVPLLLWQQLLTSVKAMA